MKIKYLVYTLLAFGLAALVVYRISANKKQANAGGPGGGRGGAPGGKGGAMPPMRVNGIVVKPQEFANNLAVTGSVEANEQIEIRGQVSGLIRSISFKEGSTVQKGQVLLKVDDAELRAQLAQAQTRQSLAAENADRAAQLFKKEAISREEYDIATADYKTLRAQTQLIRAQLAKATIVAPFSGRIGLRNVSVGSYLTPETIVANLVSTDPVKISFAVPEKYASQVKPDNQLTFAVAGSTKKYTAAVYAIEPGIEASTRTLQLRARAANPNGELRPGSFANIELSLTAIPDALLVPTQAIVPVQQGKKVFVVKNGKAREVMVETATRTEKDILVTAGLQTGDTVLTTGIMTLKPDAPVKVILSKN